MITYILILRFSWHFVRFRLSGLYTSLLSYSKQSNVQYCHVLIWLRFNDRGTERGFVKHGATSLHGDGDHKVMEMYFQSFGFERSGHEAVLLFYFVNYSHQKFLPFYLFGLICNVLWFVHCGLYSAANNRCRQFFRFFIWFAQPIVNFGSLSIWKSLPFESCFGLFRNESFWSRLRWKGSIHRVVWRWLVKITE